MEVIVMVFVIIICCVKSVGIGLWFRQHQVENESFKLKFYIQWEKNTVELI